MITFVVVMMFVVPAALMLRMMYREAHPTVAPVHVTFRRSVRKS